MLGKLGQFLATRFPERLEVTRASYEDMVRKVEGFSDLLNRVELLESRLSSVETNAAHKDAIKEIVKAANNDVSKVKEDLTALKFALGLAKTTDLTPDFFLNGEPSNGQI